MTVLVLLPGSARCPVCHDDREVAVVPVNTATTTTIPCPACIGPTDLERLLGGDPR